jgi:hypothetical protein
MRPLQFAALILMLVATVLTGFGGTLDMYTHDFRITKQHMWNDGLFIAVTAVFVLLLDMRS